MLYDFKVNNKLLLSPSYYDMVSENSFHMYILGILQAVNEDYIIRSNREEEYGRADCTLRPADKNKAAVVIEIKHVKKDDATEDEIKMEAQDALEQIIEKGYAMEMKSEGYQTILLYGMAFNGKYCEVKKEEYILKNI